MNVTPGRGPIFLRPSGRGGAFAKLRYHTGEYTERNACSASYLTGRIVISLAMTNHRLIVGKIGNEISNVSRRVLGVFNTDSTYLVNFLL